MRTHRTPPPPREPRPAPELTRSAWLTERPIPAGLLTLLDLDPALAIGAAATLGRPVAFASPWAMRLPYGAWVAAYGLLWSFETGALLPADAAAIRRLPIGALCVLLCDIAAACPRPTDVPPYITARAPGR